MRSQGRTDDSKAVMNSEEITNAFAVLGRSDAKTSEIYNSEDGKRAANAGQGALIGEIIVLASFLGGARITYDVITDKLRQKKEHQALHKQKI